MLSIIFFSFFFFPYAFAPDCTVPDCYISSFFFLPRPWLYLLTPFFLRRLVDDPLLPHLFASCLFFFHVHTNHFTHSMSRVPYCCTTHTSLVITTKDKRTERKARNHHETPGRL